MSGWGGFNALLRFLLKHVQNINRLRKPDGVDAAVCIAVVACHDFKDTGPEPFQRFRVAMLAALLGHKQGKPDYLAHRLGEALQVAPARCDPFQGFPACCHHMEYGGNNIKTQAWLEN
jgi:hypothetical protein